MLSIVLQKKYIVKFYFNFEIYFRFVFIKECWNNGNLSLVKNRFNKEHQILGIFRDFVNLFAILISFFVLAFE